LNTKDELERLWLASNQALLAFLRADLDVGFTLIGIAKSELQLGDPEGADRARHKARAVVDTVRRFEARLPLEVQPEIKERLSKLENVISTLKF
jgi:hypothetical protein